MFIFRLFDRVNIGKRSAGGVAAVGRSGPHEFEVETAN
jgi:hypothetical protein